MLMKAVIILCITSSISLGGILFTAQITNYEDIKKPALTYTIFLEKDNIRLDIKNDENTSIIFLANKEVLITLNHKNKTYTEITKETAQKLAQATEKIFKVLESELKQLPPEFQNNLKATVAPKTSQVSYKKLSSGEKIGIWVCDKYLRLRDNRKDAELWTVDPKNFKLTPEDLTVFKKLKDFFGFTLKGTITIEVEYDVGFPVRIISYEDSIPKNEFMLKKLKEEKIASQTFEIPKDYKKEQ
ncbi:MAG: DUF4412 domain-containing protein [candidate division WOR-3 bacterium]|nr:DUF4412 domain-containing protein [candidate division WOR-3 bacterium]